MAFKFPSFSLYMRGCTRRMTHQGRGGPGGRREARTSWTSCGVESSFCFFQNSHEVIEKTSVQTGQDLPHRPFSPPEPLANGSSVAMRQVLGEKKRGDAPCGEERGSKAFIEDEFVNAEEDEQFPLRDSLDLFSCLVLFLSFSLSSSLLSICFLFTRKRKRKGETTARARGRERSQANNRKTSLESFTTQAV
mgnify:FL=1